MLPPKILQVLLGTIVAMGFFAVFYIVATQAVPPDNKEIFLMLVGALVGAFTTVIGFAFGSSVGSQRKDDVNAVTAAALAKTTTNQGTP